ncbi:MAG: short-chain dehydrogenase [Gammaproteobacteria bacterium SG8_30]|nr:MAG: short-chain dehydrogenase [Gammaproteobacteria bacterium SG8_30]
MGRLDGKVAIVTGGAQGLGRADCEALIAEGARVLVTDINAEAGERLVRELNARRDGCAKFLRHDVTDEAQWVVAIDSAVATFGGLHILVNNAGIVIPATPEDTTLEQYRKHNAIMNEGTFLGCKHAIPAMAKSGGGSIINVSSVASHLGYPVFFAYTAAKGAVRAMTKSIAVWCQMQKYGIRCNSIHPGATDTPMLDAANKQLGLTEEFYTNSGPGLAKPEDIANVVVFLASDESRFVNGAEILIDNAAVIQ